MGILRLLFKRLVLYDSPMHLIFLGFLIVQILSATKKKSATKKEFKITDDLDGHKLQVDCLEAAKAYNEIEKKGKGKGDLNSLMDKVEKVKAANYLDYEKYVAACLSGTDLSEKSCSKGKDGKWSCK
jgi:hypothetical protein